MFRDLFFSNPCRSIPTSHWHVQTLLADPLFANSTAELTWCPLRVPATFFPSGPAELCR